MKDKLALSRKISTQVPDDVLEQDLLRFKRQALELGASMAEIIDAGWVEVDERVRLKCYVPLCPNYNQSFFCPPSTPPADEVRKALSRYSRALLFALEVVPTEEFSDRSIQREAGAKWARKGMEIAARIETLALASGYYLAMGLGSGSCKRALCGQEKCLMLEGGKCAYPLKARPSMEAMGIDVFGLAAKVGWDIYPIYRSVDPAAVPRAISVGIVFIR